MDFPSPMPPSSFNAKQVDTSQVLLEHNYFCLIERINCKKSKKKHSKESQRVTDAVVTDATNNEDSKGESNEKQL